jgi:hypothetical protein
LEVFHGGWFVCSIEVDKDGGGVQKGDGLFKRPSGCLLDYIRAYIIFILFFFFGLA